MKFLAGLEDKGGVDGPPGRGLGQGGGGGDGNGEITGKGNGNETS